METFNKDYELVVVGGGISGVFAAISAGRQGVRTALIQNRPVLGGNASSEIRVNINGADRNCQIKNTKESGLLLELSHRTKVVNPQNSFHILDTVLWEMVKENPNIDLYLNLHVNQCEKVANKIVSVEGFQYTTGRNYRFTAPYFADTTGDGDVAFYSGADFTIGREAKTTFNEDLAPEVADLHTMGSTIMFTTKDMGKPVPFVRPKWAYEMSEESMGNRQIKETNHGYWWVEIGGDDLSVIEDAEEIRDELMKYAFGVFDYIKNSGKYQVDNLVLDWICSTPGRRESRRVYGDYMLNQNDLDNSKYFEDTIAYGGWTMDDHSIGGIRRKPVEGERGSTWHEFKSGKQVYTIPYRCIYSRNVENLWIGGRAISSSHMAMSSTRIIATCGMVGEAIGHSVAIAKKYATSPAGVGEYILELQQNMIYDDCYLPGIPTLQTEDLIKKANNTITASSYEEGSSPQNISSEYARPVGENTHTWQSKEEDKPWVSVTFQEKQDISKIVLRFDPNFNMVVNTTLVPKRVAQQPEILPPELVKSYQIEFWTEGKFLESSKITVKDNILRVNENLCKVTCDQVKVVILETYGSPCGRLMEMQIFS